MDEGDQFPKHHGAASIERDVAAIRDRGDNLTFTTKHARDRVNFNVPWLVVVTFVDRATGTPEKVTLARSRSAAVAKQIVAVLRAHESRRRAAPGE